MPQGTRLGYLIFALCFLIGLALIPSMAQKISYSINKGAEQAKREEAAALLAQIPAGISRIPAIVKMVSPSVVGIKVFNAEDGPLGLGSGVLVDNEGFLITNFHVLGDEETGYADSVEIQLNNNKIISEGIELIGYDEKKDLALLRIDLPSLKLAPIKWGNSDKLEVGEDVLALGNPYGLEHTVTAGIVSATKRYQTDPLAEDGQVRHKAHEVLPTQEYLQTDAPINPGSSGGALINVRGELVGINTMIYGDAYQGISFAIPSNIVHKFYLDAKKNWIKENGPVKSAEQKK